MLHSPVSLMYVGQHVELMGQKNIGVRDEVHAAVESLKQPGESFSDVLLRLVAEHQERRRDWRHLVGILTPDDGAAVKEEILRHRRVGFDRRRR